MRVRRLEVVLLVLVSHVSRISVTKILRIILFHEALNAVIIFESKVYLSSSGEEGAGSVQVTSSPSQARVDLRK